MARISCCVILKNEGDTVFKTLESVKDIVSEYVIGIDDATSDNTEQEVLRFLETYSKESIVYSFKWEDDFSKARNDGIEKAKGDYILIIDGHETLKSHNIDKINFDKKVYFFDIEMITGLRRTKFQQARLFSKEYRYHNKSHNVLLYDKKDAAKLMKTTIVHERGHKLSAERIEQRKRMNIPDLKERIENGDRRAMAQIGQEYFSYQMWPEAIKSFEFYLGHEMHDSERYHVMVKLSMSYFYNKDYAKCEQVLVECEHYNFDKRNAHYVFLAELCKYFGNNDEALAWIDKALKVREPDFFYFLYPDFYYDIPNRIKNDIIRSNNEGSILN